MLSQEAAVAQQVLTFDFAVFGKKGVGKSTTGNILLGARVTKPVNGGISALKTTEKIQDIYISPEETYFKTSDDLESCTQKCQVLTHGPIRVLDVPGFAVDSATDDPEDVSNAQSVCERNLALIRNAMRVKEEFNLSFHRVLYILPQRGPIRKADAYLQDELDMFCRHFGRTFFDNMIMIATNDSSYQKQGFSDSDLEDTRKALETTLEKIWKMNKKTHPNDPEPPICPPLMYIPLGMSSESLLTKIKATSVPMGTASTTLTIVPNMCAKCGWSIVNVNGEPFEVTNGKESVPFGESGCHPKIIPKHSLIKKLGGGIAHTACLGLPLLLGKLFQKDTWPGFTNSDEICVNCHEAPGRTRGCKIIDSDYADTDKTYPVKHSNQVTGD